MAHRGGRARAACVLGATSAAAAALSTVRPPGASPADPEGLILCVVSWALWLTAAYVVVVLAIAAVLVGADRGRVRPARPGRTMRLARLALGAGVAAAGGPTVAWAGNGSAACTQPSVCVGLDPFGWSAPPPPAAAHSAPHVVRVRRGDSLWRITARALGTSDAARIAETWPRWYAANRAVIGNDPCLLQPGELLHRPLPPTRRFA